MELTHNSIRDFDAIVFSCFSPEGLLKEHRLENHALILVCDGQIDVSDANNEIIVRKGEYVFLKRDCRLKIHKHSDGEKPYSAVSIRFRRNLLKNYYRKLKSKELPLEISGFKEAAVKIESNPYLESLFTSLLPFLNGDSQPSEKFLAMKFEEALGCLLDIDKRFYPTLFDFNDAWKIDLKQFMEEHYMEDMSMEEFALYSGRSLASFKRDFSKIFDDSPQKWLIDYRLDKAYLLLSNGKGVSDTAFSVGFKNRSHFVRSFKDKYGIPPSLVEVN